MGINTAVIAHYDVNFPYWDECSTMLYQVISGNEWSPVFKNNTQSLHINAYLWIVAKCKFNNCYQLYY